MNTTTDTTTREYALVTLGRGTATHVEGWTNDTTRCVNDWNLGRRVVRTHAAGTGRPTCKKCLHSVEAGEASAAAAAPAIAEAVAEIAAEIAAPAVEPIVVVECADCGPYPGSVEQESGRVACMGCGRELKARPEITEPYTARFNDDGEAEYGFAPRSDDPAFEWHGTAPRTYVAHAANKTSLIVTDLGGCWSWRVSRVLRDAPDRSWFPRSLVWGEAADRLAEMKARLAESLCECGCQYHSQAGRGCLSIGCDCTAYVAAGTKTGGQR